MSVQEPGRAWPDTPLIFERSQPGRRAGRPPRPDLPVPDVPDALRRSHPPRLPEVSEPELVRHFTTLADRTFGVDTGFYPLGSCTMKHNPRVHERLAALPGFRDLHPYQEDEAAQGALELMWRLQEILGEIAGLPAVTLQPAAGSQGELTGLMLMRAYFADRGEERDTIITADTAHGTNPASVTMAGYKLEKVETDARGNLDLEDLRAKVNERTAGLMLTNPSTLGLFDENIEEVARIFHDAGALLYYDGANLNAVVGISRPGDMGFDIVHYNLHKTFSQPHGGGGPGGGPVAVRDSIEPYLPVPRVVREGEEYRLDSGKPKSIGRVRGFAGPVRCLRPLVRVHPCVRAGAAGDVRGRRAERELPPGAASRRVRPAVRPPLHARVRPLRAHAEAGARDHGARRREAAHGLRHPSADRLLPARRARGAHDRADRNGAEGASRRVRRRDAADRGGGGDGARPPARGATRAPGAAARRGARREAADRSLPLRRGGCAHGAGAGGSGVTAASIAIAEELVGLSHDLVRAVQEHDTARLDSLLAEEFSLDGAAGTLARDELLEAAAGAYAIDEFSYLEIDPELYGNTAVVVSRYRQTAKLGDRDASGELRVTDVWVRRDSRWQIVRRHATTER